MSDGPVKRRKLKDLDIRRIDLVDRGANQDAEILFYKSDSYQEETEMSSLADEFFTRQDIESVFTKLGQEYVDDEIAKNLDEGVAMAWEDNFEEWYPYYLAAPSEPEPELVEKSDPPVVLVKDHIFKAMMNRAEKLSSLDTSRSAEDHFLDLAQSSEGSPLYDMYASNPLGLRPLWEARSRVQKGDRSTNLAAIISKSDSWLRP